MRVGIDATVVAQPLVVGIGRFVRSLVNAFAETDADHEFLLFYRLRNLKRPHLLWCPRDPRFHIRLLGDALDWVTLPKLSLFHATYQRLPRYAGPTPYLATMHDIFYTSRPAMTRPETHQFWTARYRDVVERSRLIMTVSQFSKRELVDFLGADPQRVRVVLEAAAPDFHPRTAAEIESVRRRHGIAGRYILFAGGFEPRKNLLGALRAFASIQDRLPRDLCLAVSGGSAGVEAEARRDVAELGLEGRVRFLGFVPERDFPALMSGAEVFFFPSLFEGFGLPVLEAMACGAAVVTSSTTSLPEVAGDAALLADPADPAALGAALLQIVCGGELREDLRRRGRAWSAGFTWRQTAEETLQLYREVARHPSPVAAADTGRAAACSPPT